MLPASWRLFSDSKSNSSTLFPSTTTTRVSSAWVASISIFFGMVSVCTHEEAAAPGALQRFGRCLVRAICDVATHAEANGPPALCLDAFARVIAVLLRRTTPSGWRIHSVPVIERQSFSVLTTPFGAQSVCLVLGARAVPKPSGVQYSESHFWPDANSCQRAMGLIKWKHSTNTMGNVDGH